VGLKYAKNALAAGAPPRTPLGDLTTLFQTLKSGGEEDTTSSIHHHPRHLRRLDFRAFGAQLLCLPSVKYWRRPWSPSQPQSVNARWPVPSYTA